MHKMFLLSVIPLVTAVGLRIFEEYENCINNKVRLLRLNQYKPIPEAIIAQEGDEVKMPCQPWLVVSSTFWQILTLFLRSLTNIPTSHAQLDSNKRY